MNTKVAESTFTPEEMDAIRAEVRGIMGSEGLSQADVAKAAGLPYGTFTGWLGGSYQGRNDRVAGQVQIWLSSREETKRTAAIVPKPPEFLQTPTSTAIVDVLRFAQVMPEISVIAGGAGIGKTVTCRHYAAQNPNVWLVTMDPSSAGTHGMLAEICETLGIDERMVAKRPRAIGRRVEGAGALLIIDEAQHLKPEALDQLRSLYDRYGVGIALVGNEVVYSRLEGEGRKAGFAQLYSRVGVRHTQARPKAKDMCALIAAWNVTDAEQTRFLKAIARKPGALRGMTKCLQLASMLAAGAGEERGVRHLKAAWERLSNTVNAE